MQKLTIAIALLVAALATTGQLRHPSNPLPLAGNQLPSTTANFPVPTCPPNCSR